MKQQMFSTSGLNLQRAEGDKHEIPDGILCEDVICKMLSLADALFDTEVKQSCTTELFRAKGNAMREVLAHPQLAQDGLNCSSLSLAQLSCRECGQGS